MSKILDQIVSACQHGITISFAPDISRNAIVIQADVSGVNNVYRQRNIVDLLGFAYNKESDSIVEYMLDRMARELLWKKSSELPEDKKEGL